jgi:hypothetical protein
MVAQGRLSSVAERTHDLVAQRGLELGQRSDQRADRIGVEDDQIARPER